MKPGIHPKYEEATVVCSCGNTFQTRSTRKMLRVDLCNVCHPFYTGEQRIVDTAGQVERFTKKMEAAAAGEKAVSKRQQRLAAKTAEVAEAARRQAEADAAARAAAAERRKAAAAAAEAAAAEAAASGEAVEAAAEAPAEESAEA
jgi:large subunit ribosomal protein L31